jgi:hypothetical protein
MDTRLLLVHRRRLYLPFRGDVGAIAVLSEREIKLPHLLHATTIALDRKASESAEGSSADKRLEAGSWKLEAGKSRRCGIRSAALLLWGEQFRFYKEQGRGGLLRRGAPQDEGERRKANDDCEKQQKRQRRLSSGKRPTLTLQRVGHPERRKKKQVPHPSALCAYGLRMTAKSKGNGNTLTQTIPRQSASQATHESKQLT